MKLFAIAIIALFSMTGCDSEAPLSQEEVTLRMISMAETGAIYDQSQLGFMYEYGWGGVAQSYSEAAKWYRLAAEQGDVRAQVSLGMMYKEGKGVAQNFQESVKWYLLAAQQGNAIAQDSLGLMYKQGNGVVQDDQEAFKWIRLAAAQGYALAHWRLGTMYANGEGIDENQSVAYMWLSVAVASGNAYAVEKRDSVRAKLTPQALEQAQTQATRCFESNFQDCD